MEATTMGYVAEGKDKAIEAVTTILGTIEAASVVKIVQVTTMNQNGKENVDNDTLVEIKLLFNNGGSNGK